MWLGGGDSLSANMTCGEEDIEHFSQFGEIVRMYKPDGYHKGEIYRILLGSFPEEGRVKRARSPEGFQRRLRVLGLIGNKHIPEDYLEAGVEQRWELLRGLMDTDGCATAEGNCTYVTKLWNLAKEIRLLACSLGLKAHMNEEYSTLNGVEFGPYYRITFTPPDGVVIFNLARKQGRVRRNLNPRSRGRYLQSVNEIGKTEVNCISVEGDLYLAGREFVTTHNSLIVNVLWPAWTWCRGERLSLSGPQVKFLSVSYQADLSQIIALKMLRLVKGTWYQGHWGDRIQIMEDQKSRANFGNSAGGERLSSSIEAGLIGRGYTTYRRSAFTSGCRKSSRA